METSFLMNYNDKLSHEKFMTNLTIQKAILHSLMIIGEAANKIIHQGNYWKDHPEIDWRGMAGLRNRLIHEYFAVDYDLVWEILKYDIPELHERIQKLI